jgi:hypothetical protein
MDAANAADREDPPARQGDGKKVGRGLVRLVGMCAGPLDPGPDTAHDVVEAGSKVDRITKKKD